MLFRYSRIPAFINYFSIICALNAIEESIGSSRKDFQTWQLAVVSISPFFNSITYPVQSHRYDIQPLIHRSSLIQTHIATLFDCINSAQIFTKQKIRQHTCHKKNSGGDFFNNQWIGVDNILEAINAVPSNEPLKSTMAKLVNCKVDLDDDVTEAEAFRKKMGAEIDERMKAAGKSKTVNRQGLSFSPAYVFFALHKRSV